MAIPSESFVRAMLRIKMIMKNIREELKSWGSKLNLGRTSIGILIDILREREIAKREGYDVEILQFDMTRGLPFDDGIFDLIFHPVSNCYVEEVKPIFKECFRVLKKGGILLCGLDNGINFIFDDTESEACEIKNGCIMP